MKTSIIFILFSILFLISCSPSSPLLEPDAEELTKRSPAQFQVQFKTSEGNFTIDVKREYSPLAVDRFYYLVKNGYYESNRFFRVLPNFVVQWGMKGDPKIDEIWSEMGIKDEEVKLSNTKGTISFARSIPNTRSNQLFINLGDNIRLDNSEFNGVKGFPAFGKITVGMDVVESINSEYLQKPDQDSIRIKGNEYLNRNFPNLDYIISATVIEE
jgi:cyclophilin family peptidyl-prolyl cis-trans isomerase